MPIHKDPRATQLCDEIRTLFAINERSGWIACPHHGRRQIQLGHRDYQTGDPAIDSQVEALAHAVEHLGLAQRIGYQVATINRQA